MTRPLRQLAPAQIVELCARHFGLDVEFDSFLPGEIAINVLVRSRGRTYVLKAEYPSPSTTAAHVDWVCRIQERARAAGLPVAAQLPAAASSAFVADRPSGALALVPIDGPDAPQAMVRVHEFLPGRVAAGAQQPADHPAQLGRLAARLVAALAQAPAEPEPVLHPWSFETTGANVIFTCDRISSLEAAGQVPAEHGARLSADLALARFHAQAFDTGIRPRLGALPHQIVHQDLNDFNILLDEGGISGVIDFNDSRTAPRVAEISIAAAYAMVGREDPRAALRSTVQAYQEAARTVPELRAAALGDEELEIIEHAAIARLCLDVCTWTARSLTARPDSPKAVFGRSRMASVWPVVRTLLAG